MANNYKSRYSGEEIDAILTFAKKNTSLDSELSETSTNPVQNKVIYRELANVEAVAKGRATGYVFDTVDDMNEWLTNPDNVAKLTLGDNFYIRDTSVPDYWWDKDTGTAQELETQKVDLSEYVQTEDGKGLSANDYTDAEKEILFDILSGILDLGKLGTHQLKIGLPETNEFITIDSRGISGTLPFTIDCRLGQLINCCGLRSDIIEYMDATGKWVTLNSVIYNLQDGLASVRGDIEDIKPFLEKFKYYGTSNIEITDPSLFTFDASTGTITGYTGTETDIVIPYEIDGVKVVSIGESSFFDSQITSVVMPNSIINMGKYAFMTSTELLNVTLSNKLVSISDSAFEYCPKLAEITIPDSVTSIGNRAFERCESLSNITLSKTLTYIGTTAFMMCNLTNIILPISLTRIDGSAFYDCNNLTDVYYEGAKEQWKSINIDNGNDPILNATIHYEQVPTTKGYVDEQIETILDNIIATEEMYLLPNGDEVGY